MKPLDQFKRTPLRRYDKAPPPPPEEKRTLEPAIRKRYFGVPSFERMHAGRWLGGRDLRRDAADAVQRQRADGRCADGAAAFYPVGGHSE